MRVAEEVALGEASIAMRLEGWPEGGIVPSTHRIAVVSRKPLPAVQVSPQQRGVWAFDGYTVSDLRYTPDGRSVIVVLRKGRKEGNIFQFRLCDAHSGQERARVLQIESEPLKTLYSPYLAVSADGKFLAVRYNVLRFTKVGKDYQSREYGLLHVIDLESGRQLWEREWDTLGIYGASFSPDGKTLVTGHTHFTTGTGSKQRRSYTGTVKFWDALSGKEKGSLPRGSFQVVWEVQFSPQGKYVWVSDEHRDNPSLPGVANVEVWDVATSEAQMHLAQASEATFSPDDTHIVANDVHGNIKLYEVPNGRVVAARSLNLKKGWISARLWSADSKYIYLTSSQGGLWRWEPLRTADPVKVESVAPDTEQLRRNAYSQDWHLASGLYAFGVNGELPRRNTKGNLADDYAELPPPQTVVWDLCTMQRRAVLTGHHGCINCLAFSPDGKTLASGGTDGTIRFWDVTKPHR